MAFDWFLNVAPHGYEHFEDAAQQVRLIHVHRGSDGIIHCDLQTFWIHNLPGYLALSYTWGAPAPVCKVMVDGKCLEIRENLYHFLEEFSGFSHDYIWIDQISTNQLDVQERNLQVGLMAKIYSQAAYVVVWLGKNERHRQAALRLNLAEKVYEVTELDYIGLLLRNVYFTRLWIVQEILLAKEVRVMVHWDVWVPWDTLSVVADFDFGAAIDHPVSALCLINCNVFFVPDTLIQLLAFFGESKCEDPHDKVYSLLGLVREETCIVPDYSKSMQELYGDVSKAVCVDYMKSPVLLPSASLCNFMRVFGKSLGVDDLKSEELERTFDELNSIKTSAATN
jgi:hypothetical protein